jgi:hypothetical protein
MIATAGQVYTCKKNTTTIRIIRIADSKRTSKVVRVEVTNGRGEKSVRAISQWNLWANYELVTEQVSA